MTTLLLTVLGFFAAYAIYIATRVARQSRRAEDYLDGGGDVPGWAFLFAATGVVVAGLGLYDHYLLLARFGLQYSHVALGVVLAALAGVLVQKRLWLAARITGLRTLGELLGTYYGSTGLRTLVFLLLVLFTIPFVVMSLSRLGGLIEIATMAAVPRTVAIWGMAFFLFLGGVIGGWRAVIYIVAMQSLLLLTLIVTTAGMGAVALDWLAVVRGEAPVQRGMLAHAIPGVIQGHPGIGMAPPVGGLWTTTAILTTALALVGIVVSPAFAFLGITSRGNGFAFQQVWLTAGLATGIVLVFTPLIGAGLALANPDAALRGEAGYAAVLARVADFDALFAVGMVLMVTAGLQIAVAFFAQAGASIFVIELLGRFILPQLDGRGRRLAGRISLAVIYLLTALLAAFAPLASEVFATLAPSLAVQLLPAIVGLCWVAWVSRGAVMAGLIIGIVLVVFTEPPGLILFSALFVELPWGRWPLTIHSAAWGLVFNVAAVLLACIFTRRGAERDHRERLHRVYRAEDGHDFGGRAARGAKWSLVLIWAFLAIGPGAILGNWFFTEPMFTGTGAAVGMPSLWIWQIFFWVVGVFIVWWLAYQARMSIVATTRPPALELEPQADGPEVDGGGRRRPPRWLAQFLERFAQRRLPGHAR